LRRVDIEFRLLRPTDVAERLAISRSKVYTLIEQGQLQAVKIGRSTRIPLRSVYDFVQRLSSAETVAHPCVILDDMGGPI
jgi:excisionase family DNA binding protein